MYKTAVKWEPDYWQDEGLPSSGCFGFVNGHLILGKGHHQLIMARLISAGWTWEQLMEAEQAWGWYNLEPVSYHEQYFDIENMKDWQKHSYFVHVMFTSDAGYQNEDAKNGALGAFASMYHIPAKEDKSYGSYGVDKNVNKEYGSGLKGLQNADKYLKDPKHYFQNQKKLFQNVPQPPGSEWDPEWEEKLKNVTNPDVEEVEQEQKQYMPELEKHVIPSTVPPAVEEWYPSLEKQHGENPLNGIYFTSGSNWLLYTNGYATWYNNNGNVETPTSPVSHETMQGWINSMKIDKVGPKTFGGYEGVYVNSQHPDTSNHLHIDSDSATWKHPTTGDVVGASVLDPASIKNHIDQGKLIKAPGSFSVGDKVIYNPDKDSPNPKIYEVSEVTPNDISIVWPEMMTPDGVSYDTEKFKEYFTKVSYTPGGKTKGWGDIMEKANYIRGNGGVQITSNEPQHVTGTVQSGTDPGNKGPYHTEIWRDDPQSQAITMWDCDCDWDQYAWGRTRQWKKYEGRPCCHVLALYWDALQNPPAGGGAQPAAPPTPTPGGGVTVNQGLIAPVGQPPMNVPLIGPEEAPAPMGPEEAPQPAWSEVVQPGKEEGTITFPGTFSHWKESKVNIPDDSREELENFWHKHPDLRAECKKKYGYDPVDEADGYWPHGLGDEPEHHVIWDAVKDGDEFTIGLVKKWEKQELAAAKKESSAPTDPPNYRKANKPNEKCGACKMFFKGKCWGYGNKPVEKNMVCDSFTPDTKTSGWLEELRAMPNSFKNGDIVRVWEDTEGYAQAAYGQPDYPTMITRNMSGEVLSSNPETTIAIFPLKTGPLEHHLVRVEAPTSNFYLDNTNAQPFVKKKQSNLVSTPPSNN